MSLPEAPATTPRAALFSPQGRSQSELPDPFPVRPKKNKARMKIRKKRTEQTGETKTHRFFFLGGGYLLAPFLLFHRPSGTQPVHPRDGETLASHRRLPGAVTESV